MYETDHDTFRVTVVCFYYICLLNIPFYIISCEKEKEIIDFIFSLIFCHHVGFTGINLFATLLLSTCVPDVIGSLVVDFLSSSLGSIDRLVSEFACSS